MTPLLFSAEEDNLPSHMNVAFISLVSAAAIAIVGWIFTYLQLRTERKAHALDVAKATPQLGTEIRIDKRQENPSTYPAFYYIVVSIYNAGQLAASDLKGNCRIYSTAGSIKNREIPIHREFLDNSTPYQLESYRLDDSAGTTIDLFPTQIRQNISFNIYIEFEFSGFPNAGRQSYKANYGYEPKSNQIIRISES
ncbi:MAG: hypothetical protein ACRD4S_01020 [Candidatus Acidiferrales bacterium]